MNTQHTPLPWQTDGSRVWHQLNPGGRKTFVAEVSADPSAIQREANARLIAAAPSLLAALERALPWIGKMIADKAHLNSVAPNDCVGAMQQAEAALCLARGTAPAAAEAKLSDHELMSRCNVLPPTGIPGVGPATEAKPCSHCGNLVRDFWPSGQGCYVPDHRSGCLWLISVAGEQAKVELAKVATTPVVDPRDAEIARLFDALLVCHDTLQKYFSTPDNREGREATSAMNEARKALSNVSHPIAGAKGYSDEEHARNASVN